MCEAANIMSKPREVSGREKSRVDAQREKRGVRWGDSVCLSTPTPGFLRVSCFLFHFLWGFMAKDWISMRSVCPCTKKPKPIISGGSLSGFFFLEAQINLTITPRKHHLKHKSSVYTLVPWRAIAGLRHMELSVLLATGTTERSSATRTSCCCQVVGKGHGKESTWKRMPFPHDTYFPPWCEGTWSQWLWETCIGTRWMKAVEGIFSSYWNMIWRLLLGHRISELVGPWWASCPISSFIEKGET